MAACFAAKLTDICFGIKDDESFIVHNELI